MTRGIALGSNLIKSQIQTVLIKSFNIRSKRVCSINAIC